MIGETIENFRIVSLLGRGGMGEVYRGEQVMIQTPAAIKVLHAEISADKQHIQRFFNEARIVQRIKHAGVVKISNVGYHRDRAYLIMELLEGESLAKRIERIGRLPPPLLADVARQTASVLAATHRAGITHRDLKPDNIFLVYDADLGDRERVKVLDFGIAKLTSSTLAKDSPMTSGTMGTPAYMAPEQWGDSSLVDWRADAYSLGCLAFEMATGQPPYFARTIAEAFTKHTQASIPSVRGVVPDFPPALDAIIMQLLAKQPDARGRSMDEIVRAFEAAAQGGPSVLAETLPPSSFTPRPVQLQPHTTMTSSTGQVSNAELPRRRSGRKLFVASMLASIVVVGAVVAIVMARGNADDKPTVAAPDPVPAPAPAPVPAPTPAPVPAPAAESPTIVAARDSLHRADALRRIEKWSDACPLYVASYRDAPQLESLLGVAGCDEHAGHTKEALAGYREALELANKKSGQEEYAKFAEDRIAALSKPASTPPRDKRPLPPASAKTVKKDTTTTPPKTETPPPKVEQPPPPPPPPPKQDTPKPPPKGGDPELNGRT